MKNWSRQTTKETLTDATVILFGKYRLKTISEIKEIDPGYYDWMKKTFKIEVQ